jgi:HPt (histidine-containing phosphotransfer) domain-containing protein
MLSAPDVVGSNVLDVGRLLRMRDYLDANAFLDIVEEYKSRLQSLLNELDCKSTKNSPVDLRRISHDLVNVAGTLGMSELVLASEQLMHLIRSERHLETLTYLAEDIIAAGARALCAIEKYLSNAAR